MADFVADKYKFSTKTPSALALEEVIDKRREEIAKLGEELLNYKILIKDLYHDEPSYITRNKILNISYFIIEDVEIFEIFDTTKKFPMNRLLRRTPINKEFLEEWKEHIIAYAIILADPYYKNLQDYLQIVESVNIFGAEEISQSIKEEEHRGILLEKLIGAAVILTSKGEFVKVKAEKDAMIGEEVVAKEGFRVGKYKLQISIFLSIVVLVSAIFIFSYKRLDKTIVIDTTSSITLEVNKYDTIINAYTATEKGNIMLDELNLHNGKLDESVLRIIDYASKNEMIPESGIIITVTGNALEYNALEKTEKFIDEKDLKVKLNNSGDEHKVSP